MSDLESFAEIGADAMHYEDRHNARYGEEEYPDEEIAARFDEVRDREREEDDEA